MIISDIFKPFKDYIFTGGSTFKAESMTLKFLLMKPNFFASYFPRTHSFLNFLYIEKFYYAKLIFFSLFMDFLEFPSHPP
jgi:hypothetical protein